MFFLSILLMIYLIDKYISSYEFEFETKRMW